MDSRHPGFPGIDLLCLPGYYLIIQNDIRNDKNSEQFWGNCSSKISNRVQNTHKYPCTIRLGNATPR